MRGWSLVPVVIAVQVVVGCQVAEREASRADPSAAEELTRRLAGYEGALVDGDPATVKDFWTPDARVLLPGMDLDGAAIATFVDEFYAAGGEAVSVEFRTDDRFVHGDAAYELGRYEETARSGDGAEEFVRGNYFLRWERGSDGAWRIDRFVGGPVDAPTAPDG
ncbi:MAG: nuclear transport factor 2 family protein [Gemmatimonadota bacterium]|nr:nuclear transport factor 2 family protein [Gemmatimonadota bacterium]